VVKQIRSRRSPHEKIPKEGAQDKCGPSTENFEADLIFLSTKFKIANKSQISQTPGGAAKGHDMILTEVPISLATFWLHRVRLTAAHPGYSCH